jgi:hypothetical protein
MTTVNEAFPSRWLGAEDLQGRDRTVTIRRYVHEDVQGTMKHILYLDGEKKGWMLNRTNAVTIARLYGEVMEKWAGKPVTLFRADVRAFGQMWPVIRVRPVRPAQKAANGQPAKPAEPLVHDYDPDEVSDLADEDEGVPPAHDKATGEIPPPRVVEQPRQRPDILDRPAPGTPAENGNVPADLPATAADLVRLVDAHREQHGKAGFSSEGDKMLFVTQQIVKAEGLPAFQWGMLKDTAIRAQVYQILMAHERKAEKQLA